MRGPSFSMVSTVATGNVTSAREASVLEGADVISSRGTERRRRRCAMSMSMRFSPVRLMKKPTCPFCMPAAERYCIVIAGWTVVPLFAMRNPEAAICAMLRFSSIA